MGWVRGPGGQGVVEGWTAASPPPQPVVALIARLQAALCWAVRLRLCPLVPATLQKAVEPETVTGLPPFVP